MGTRTTTVETDKKHDSMVRRSQEPKALPNTHIRAYEKSGKYIGNCGLIRE